MSRKVLLPSSYGLSGVIVPLTTPFDQAGEIDYDAFLQQIEWVLGTGVHGIVVGGSTGEGYTLTEDELFELTRKALDTVNGRVPVMASIISDSTRGACKRAEMLASLPITALQVAPPHYIFSPSAEGLCDFYADVGKTGDRPVIIYNVISWANVSPTVAAAIMDRSHYVIGVKQSDRDLGSFIDLTRTIGPERVFGAIDGSLMSCYDLGIAGSIAAIATAVPAPSVALWNNCIARESVARDINGWLADFWMTLSTSNLPAQVKAAQSLQGLKSGFPRSPMQMATGNEVSRIETALQRKLPT
ncbi:dihydrodipicolinate synthase family protein [Microvirga lotononidis]|uniref:Dihydrodipicolinate synthase/N-acetylneuraminate lyase n=1 Tax=Microvirga lotononidis TaxID=864069 RepID=I4Z138_9HYPH|nr:dihydrodipicolinate synthase family protein [Microvirga lotononidis]EIM29930.1 dihydrodipicolinate synthase/N-acetylneuraminate lyase [Microvirga lotononidis]WQO32008.1 dihydrodipicolinate synthase family protein [Microvirga lotononidis]